MTLSPEREERIEAFVALIRLARPRVVGRMLALADPDPSRGIDFVIALLRATPGTIR